MPRYRVTLTRTSNEIIEADNPFMAALAARDRYGDDIAVSNVAPAVGRPSARTTTRRPAKKAAKTAVKRRKLSPENRAKLAQNLAKARAARAAKAKAAKRTGASKRKRAAKKR
jgi:hypothetical protein